MKFIKTMIIVLLLSISSSYAQDAMIDVPADIEVAQTIDAEDAEVVATEEAEVEDTLSSEFFELLTTFISSALLAFILCIGFPKFFKKTSAILVDRNKFRIIFEGMKAIFILLIIGMLGAFVVVGIYPAAMAISLALALYFVGIPTFSKGLLEAIFNKRNIKFDKLTKINKFISLLSINIILFIIILPFKLFIPEYVVKADEMTTSIDLASNFLIMLISVLGIGMFVIHLTEVVKKNYKKL